MTVHAISQFCKKYKCDINVWVEEESESICIEIRINNGTSIKKIKKADIMYSSKDLVKEAIHEAISELGCSNDSCKIN